MLKISVKDFLVLETNFSCSNCLKLLMFKMSVFVCVCVSVFDITELIWVQICAAIIIPFCSNHNGTTRVGLLQYMFLKDFFALLIASSFLRLPDEPVEA